MMFFLGVLSASFYDACVYHSRGIAIRGSCSPRRPSSRALRESHRAAAGQGRAVRQPFRGFVAATSGVRVRAIDRYRDWDYNQNGETSFPEVGR